jgi:hypothetical protein
VRRDIEATYPRIEHLVGGRPALDDAAKVVAKLAHDGAATESIGRPASVVRDQPCVQQCPDAFQIARGRLVVDVNHHRSLLVARSLPVMVTYK